MALGIRRFKRLERFGKAYRRLTEQNRAAVDAALAELLRDGTLSPGRNLKKVRSGRRNQTIWAIRVNRGIRLTFEVSEGTCILRNVGDHDKTLDDS